MGSFSAYVENIKNASVTIFEGMAVTLSWMFRRPMTLQYPDKTPTPVKDLIPVRFRGLLEVDITSCTACGACMRACPIDVILVETEKAPGGKGRYLTRFDIDASKCMYCGLCTEGCPTGCLRHSSEFETASRDIRNLILHYVNEPVVPFKQKKGEPGPEFPPLGENARKVLKGWDAKYTHWTPGPMPEAPPEEAEVEEKVRPARKAAENAETPAEKRPVKPKVRPDTAKEGDETEGKPKASAQPEASVAGGSDQPGVEASAGKAQPSPAVVDKPAEVAQGSQNGGETADTPSVDQKPG